MLTHKTIFITGASSGIGTACATHFAKLGAKLLLCARNLSTLNQLADTLQTQYGTVVHTLELDVRQSAMVQTALQTVPTAFQDIDILINNAGLAAGLDTLQEGQLTDWEAMIDTNVKGLLFITRAVLPRMIARDTGHIVNLGSVAGHHTYPKGAVYCATKAAVKTLTEGLRMDLFGTQIRVTTVDPGAVATNFSLVRFKGDAEKAKAVYAGIQALTPEDIADTIAYCVTRPPHVNISEVIIMPTAQASATMMARKTEED